MGRNPSRDLLDDIRDVDYGPKMKALTEMQRKFVSILMMQVGTNYQAAAIEAGYAPVPAVGHRLAHDKKVQEAMREEVDRRVEVGGVIGVKALVDIALNPNHKDHFKAAESLADRAGYSKKHRLDVSHTHRDLTGDALMARIKELANKHGLDPERLLKGDKPPMRTIEAGTDTVLPSQVSELGVNSDMPEAAE